jgi:hypothetical protein
MNSRKRNRSQNSNNNEKDQISRMLYNLMMESICTYLEDVFVEFKDEIKEELDGDEFIYNRWIVAKFICPSYTLHTRGAEEMKSHDKSDKFILNVMKLIPETDISLGVQMHLHKYRRHIKECLGVSNKTIDKYWKYEKMINHFKSIPKRQKIV